MAQDNSSQREDTYIFPNSDTENSRLDFQHELFNKTFDGLHRASLDASSLHEVLDIGCGTGNWASDFAFQYPNAKVLALDIEEKPGRRTSPSNYTFQIADLHSSEDWSKLGHFDYIHARFIAVSVRNWPDLLQQCFAHLNPGGYIEFQDLHFPFQITPSSDAASSKVVEWSNFMIEASSKLGLDTELMAKFPTYLENAGFVDIRTEEFKMYTGPWMEDEGLHELGRMGQKNLITGFPGFSKILFPKVLGWEMERYDAFMEETLDEMRTVKYKTWLPMKVCVARKAE